jgi:hypothetical protein
MGPCELGEMLIKTAHGVAQTADLLTQGVHDHDGCSAHGPVGRRRHCLAYLVYPPLVDRASLGVMGVETLPSCLVINRLDRFQGGPGFQKLVHDLGLQGIKPGSYLGKIPLEDTPDFSA